LKSALIGYTGFVGSNILSQHQFDNTYNSKNIENMAGQEFDLVVSAANRSEMWKINQDPSRDLEEINKYISVISKTKIKKLVLISTVGVYDNPIGVDEDSAINEEKLTPYGANRLYLEKYCKENFNTTVIRLPGLYGSGLKKNVIYDLIHANQVERIHKDGIYQYYNLENIWQDINIALKNRIDTLNLATPPLSNDEMARKVFGVEFTNAPINIKPAHFDMQTKHGSLFGSNNRYICSKEDEIKGILKFVESQKKERS